MPVKTRTKKRKLDDDRSPLWKLVTEISDMFEKEILTKLNEIDVKCFYDVNTESRAVVIRSKIELNNERRDVEKVKSMRELALAWEYYRFGEENMFCIEFTQELFCWRVAQTNNLDFLKWAREVKQCAWDTDTISQAASQGNLDMVKYCVENGCPMDEEACSNAAKKGHLDVLKYLHEHGCPWDSKTCYYAAGNGHLDVLMYSHGNDCPWDFRTCKKAYRWGHSDCFEYAFRNGCEVYREGEFDEDD
jgi:hypothetical protein